MIAGDIAFVGALCFRFPVLIALLQEHLDDYDGLLPHVFLGDVTRWVLQQFQRDKTDATVREVIEFIGDAFADSHCEELITASFLENLPREQEEGAAVRSLLSPALQLQLRKVG